MLNAIRVIPKVNTMASINPNYLGARAAHIDGRLKGKVAVITASTDG